MMDDAKRKKLLLAIFGGVIVVYWGSGFVSDKVFAPIEKARLSVVNAESRLDKLTTDEIRLGVDRRDLKDWRDISLPEDQLTAQRLYREWIEILAQQCAFSGLSVEPGSKNSQTGRFHSVSVDVKGETDLAGLSRFLYLFDQAAMLHRVTQLKIESSGSQGNPRLAISLTAEGMSVVRSGDRLELFSRTALSDDVTESATTLTVQKPELFPKEGPFLARINRELLQVKSVAGNVWTVERASNGTKSAVHLKDAVVELLPVQWDRRERSFDRYQAFLAAQPFALPAPPKTWAPRVTGLTDQSIKPGEEVRLTAKGDGFNPEFGQPTFALSESVEGMKIDEESGELVWKTPDNQPVGKYIATVLMVQPQKPEAKVQAKVTVTVAIPNVAPVLELPTSAIVVLGQEFSLTPKATDDGPADKLTYSLGVGAPVGLVIDPKTGELKWTPPISFTPGEYDTTVKVTDSGTEAKSASAKITLNVKDDAAMLTQLTGCTSKDGLWQAWFRNKGTGDVQLLKIGERLKVAEIDAEVVSIEDREVRLRDEKGLWSLKLTNRGSVRDRTLVEPAVVPAATPEAAAPAATPDPAAPAAESPAVPPRTTSEAPASPTDTPKSDSPAPADPNGAPVPASEVNPPAKVNP